MKPNFWKFPSSLFYFGWVFFVSHEMFSFAYIAIEGGFQNLFTFPSMHAMVWMLRFVQQVPQGKNDTSVNLLILLFTLPTIIVNSILWILLAVMLVRLAMFLFEKKRT